MLTVDPVMIVSGVESVVIFQTDHRNWPVSNAGILTLHDQAGGDYITIEQTAAEGITARIKSTAGGGIEVWDTVNNEAVFLGVRTPVQMAIEKRSLPEVKQSQPKGSPLRVTHK